MVKLALILIVLVLMGAFPMAYAANQPNVVCACGNVTPGLDTSDHQPKIAWTEVQKSGHAFAFVKATEGVTFLNPDFLKDWLAAKANGLFRGAYNFFNPEDD